MRFSILDVHPPIKTTKSRCPACRREIDATIIERDGRIVMRKRCAEHGPFEVTIAKDKRYWYDSRGSGSCCGEGCCCGPKPEATASADPFDTLSTCIALIEIVDSCNLTCPTCYASSPFGVHDDVKCSTFDDVVRRVQSVIDRKGLIDILQLSGGEPTIHPRFFDILNWALDHAKIGYVLVNTNAVRVATDAAFRAELARLRASKRKFELYVQFDGPQEDGQRELRGSDLRAIRTKAIDEAGAAGVPSTLAMTVTPTTIAHLGDTLRYGVARRHVRGISFQPMFTSGRVHAVESTLPIAHADPQPISVGDVIDAIVTQAPELVGRADFTPLPCGDPNCHTIGYLLRTSSGTTGISKLVDLASVQGFLRDRVDYRLEDLARCGCESEPLGAILKELELSPDAPFRMFIKPFMDAWTFDQDRIDRCCTHVIRADGSLDSFCRHYLGAAR
ncbi:MAG: radical SAM protein [Phycisphaerales bacterium]